MEPKSYIIPDDIFEEVNAVTHELIRYENLKLDASIPRCSKSNGQRRSVSKSSFTYLCSKKNK